MFSNYIILNSWVDEYHWTYHVEGSKYTWNNKNSWFDLLVHNPRKIEPAPAGKLIVT